MVTKTDEQKKADTELARRFQNGDLDFIETYSMASPENLQYALTKGFEYVCYNGHLDVVKFLLTSNKLTQNADIHHDDDYAVTLGSFCGHLDLVRYLLTSKDLKEHANIHARENSPLIWAAQNKQLEVVQYLLESSEIKEHADINLASVITGGNAFMGACDQNAISVVYYLAQREDLDIEKALYTLNHDDKDGFMLACENHEKDTEIVDFIVFEMNFQPSERHHKYFRDNAKNPQISYAAKIIKIRDLNDKLTSDLSDKPDTTLRIKI